LFESSFFLGLVSWFRLDVYGVSDVELLAQASLQRLYWVFAGSRGSAVVEHPLGKLIELCSHKVEYELTDHQAPLPGEAVKLEASSVDLWNVQDAA
jgi:hypothetical protein